MMPLAIPLAMPLAMGMHLAMRLSMPLAMHLAMPLAMAIHLAMPLAMRLGKYLGVGSKLALPWCGKHGLCGCRHPGWDQAIGSRNDQALLLRPLAAHEQPK